MRTYLYKDEVDFRIYLHRHGCTDRLRILNSANLRCEQGIKFSYLLKQIMNSMADIAIIPVKRIVTKFCLGVCRPAQVVEPYAGLIDTVILYLINLSVRCFLILCLLVFLHIAVASSKSSQGLSKVASWSERRSSMPRLQRTSQSKTSPKPPKNSL